MSHHAVAIVARRLATDLAAGAEVSERVGDGVEYAGSRPYQAGDSLRRLDWRVTARQGEPFSREYESLLRVPFFIVVDNSASMRASSVAVSKLDAAHWIAAAVGMIAIRNMAPVGVLGLSEETSGSRPTQRERDLLAGLHAIAEDTGGGSVGLGEAILRVLARAESTCMVFIVSDFHDPEAAGALRRASARHDVIAVHLTDPVERVAKRIGFVDAVEAETGRRSLITPRTHEPVAIRTRRWFIESGCDHIEIGTDRPFVRSLRRALSVHARVARGGR